MFMMPEEIRKLRKARGWSTEDLAQRVGCTTRTVRRWETGESIPLPIYTDKLKHVLECDGRE